MLQTATDSAATLVDIQNTIGTLNRVVQVLTQRHEQPVDDANVHGDHGVDFDFEEDDEQAAARRERLQRQQQQPQPPGLLRAVATRRSGCLLAFAVSDLL